MEESNGNRVITKVVVALVILTLSYRIIPSPPEDLTVELMDITVDNHPMQKGNSAKVGDGEHAISVRVKVTDKKNIPIQNAKVTLKGYGGDGNALTDSSGMAIVKMGSDGEGNKITLKSHQESIDLKLIVEAKGFNDYIDEGAITLYK